MKTRYVPTNPVPPSAASEPVEADRSTFDLLNALASQFSTSQAGPAGPSAAPDEPLTVAAEAAVTPAPAAELAVEQPVASDTSSERIAPRPVVDEPTFFGALPPAIPGELSAKEELELLRRGVTAAELVPGYSAPAPEVLVPVVEDTPGAVVPDGPSVPPIDELPAAEVPALVEPVEPVEPAIAAETPRVPEAEAAAVLPVAETAGVERAAQDEALFFQDEPGVAPLTEGVVFDTATDWMLRNGMPYDKIVVMRGYPKINSSWPCRLSVALVHGAYCVNKGQAFQIFIPEARDPLLVGATEAGELYGVGQVCEQLTSVYEALRYVFIAYQASFPTKMTLGPDAPEGGPAEVLMVQLEELLERAHQQTRLADGSLSLMDLIGAAVVVALTRMFGGLVPLAELGRLLQDKERMDWITTHSTELLGTATKKSRYDV